MLRGPTVSLTPRHQTSTSQPQTCTLPWPAWRVTSTLTRPDAPVSGVSTSGQSRWPATVSPWLHPGLTQHWMSSRSGALAWPSAAMARTRGATVAGGTPRARAIALGVLPRARSARTRLVNSSLSMPGSSHLPVPAGHARAGRVALVGQRGGGDVGHQGWPDLLPRHPAREIRRPVPPRPGRPPMPTMPLPQTLMSVLAAFAPCFTVRTFATFQALVVGFLAQPGARTVTGMLTGAGLAGRRHHDLAYRFFASARWSADQVGLVVAGLAVGLLPANAPLLVAVDDTLLRRTGRQLHGSAWHHDGAGPGRHRPAWGHRWVVLGVLVGVPFVAHRPLCLPVLARLWRPGATDHTPSVLARELLDLLTERFPERAVHLVGDAAYATRAWRGLPGRATVTTRLRCDAALHAPAPAPTGLPGRPRVKGARLPDLTMIAGMTRYRWTLARMRCYGKTTNQELLVLRCLWYGVLGGQPVQVVLARAPGAPDGYDLALVSTDLDATGAELVERYAARWEIEQAFLDSKHRFGIADARIRRQRSVERVVPFTLAATSLAIIWYTRHGQPAQDLAAYRARAPWYTTKQAVSVADMLTALRRVLLTARFRQPHPDQAICDLFPDILLNHLDSAA